MLVRRMLLLLCIVAGVIMIMAPQWSAIHRAHNLYGPPPAMAQTDARKEICKPYTEKGTIGRWLDVGSWKLCGDLD